MIRNALCLLILIFWLGYSSPGLTQEVHYLEKLVDREAALIQISGQEYEVSLGTLVPGWGTVRQITDSHLILDHPLSQEEKDELWFQGAAEYDTLQIRIPHEAIRVVPGHSLGEN
jgi:hypothetical protein